ncbi:MULTISPECIES: PTS sugar transporter subunit IIB [Listeria]|uniref:PTS sugar transporter n=2 Tax=Listeria TaxID=1637 RepID=A0A099WJL7_9LIST|nr:MULTISPECIES: PTS sugar transporter subunit IIB [Listeria]EUJ46573.1 PTS system beta-glucoside-specific transporter subunit IIB [Listeria riparia FSL S10-1204]KGL44330.1 PTS sugar transporter [Listeria booriae]MBC1212109.1 PTS sugar transporter subunit IIB [Listeria booriae]MBC1228378.1 PTS sugar transporter subunit IIB [Listeria booriae]MBC1231810.1 PTS sugar transporter subunit IIB [Listeria booriae]
MKTIMLVCSAGMSTSLLVTKMEKAAEERNLEATIFAVSEAEAPDNINKIDVLLLGPQVRFLESKFKKKLEPLGKPVAVINSIDYGMMNGEKVLNQALSLLGE